MVTSIDATIEDSDLLSDGNLSSDHSGSFLTPEIPELTTPTQMLEALANSRKQLH